MSGIFGFTSWGREDGDQEHALTRIGESLVHTSFQHYDCLFERNSSVGLGRISTRVFNPDQQPISSEDRKIFLVMEGEFYGHESRRQDLTRQGIQFKGSSHAEYLLRLYQEKGLDLVEELEGIFIAAILDLSARKLFLISDRFGHYPCYYTVTKRGLYFAPAVRPLLTHSGMEQVIDPTAVAQYFRFQHLLGDRTFFEGINLLPEASILEYNLISGQTHIEKYWDYDQIPDIREDISFDEAVEETGRLFRKSIEKRSSPEGPTIGVYLSGGMDSRTILGMVNRQNWPTLHTITYGHKNCRDVAYSRAIAAKLGADHHWFEFADGRWVTECFDLHLKLTEGFHSWIHLHGITTAGAARKYMDVNLSGLGGGFLMGGRFVHPSLYDAPDDTARAAKLFELFNQKTTWPSISEAEEKLLYNPEVYAIVSERAYESFLSEFNRASHYDPRRKSEYLKLKNPDRRLFWMFPVFFRAFLEMRFPYFDYQLFEFMFSLPPHYRAGSRLHRAVLQKELPLLTRIPHDKDNLLPTNNRFVRETHRLYTKSRDKLMREFPFLQKPQYTLYADYENYLRHELREWAENILFDEQTLGRGYFNPVGLRSLFSRHLSGIEEWTIGKIASIISFEMMLRYLLEDDSEESYRDANGLPQSLPLRS
jgi:asparagine synthase (glutamine-hydrolysing)